MTATPFDSNAVHRDTLASAIAIAEQAHAKYAELWPDTIGREDAIAAVILEAEGYWQLDLAPLTRRGTGITVDEYQELAGAVVEYIREHADSLVFALAPQHVRRDALSAVTSSIFGPGDDDSGPES